MNGDISFEEIPNIPEYGERVEDIGMYRRRDLKEPHNLKSNFKDIRNYFAANNVGATRDETFAQQFINLLFCKIYDERFTKKDDIVMDFFAGSGSLAQAVYEINDEDNKKISYVLIQLPETVNKTSSVSITCSSLSNATAKKYLSLIPANSNIFEQAQNLARKMGTDIQTIKADVSREAMEQTQRLNTQNEMFNDLPSPTGVAGDRFGNIDRKSVV